MEKLSKNALSAVQYVDTPYMAPNPNLPKLFYTGTEMPNTYVDELRQCRFFYRYDPIASTVINRMAEMVVGKIRLRKRYCTDEEYTYYAAILPNLIPMLQSAALQYLVSGMAIPEYGTRRIMGTLIDPNLGRTRYHIPDPVWVRNPENIILRRNPGDSGRSVYLKVPADEREFIRREGVYPDGIEDRNLYNALVKQFPGYVDAIKRGVAIIPLPHVHPILRKPLPESDWPQPFLVPALSALKHKLRIKQMDYSIATRAVEAIQHIRAGDKDFPITEEDTTLDAVRTQLAARSQYGVHELIYRLFTNHTVTIEWIYPPLDALLSDGKYVEPNNDIFMAMGFARVLLIGESNRSNAGNSVSTTIGPIATLNEIRGKLIDWILVLFGELKTLNGFKNVPTPAFAPVPTADIIQLAQFAVDAAKVGAISLDTVAQFYNTDFDTEQAQIKAEADQSGNDPLAVQAVKEKQQPKAAPVQPTKKDTTNGGSNN